MKKIACTLVLLGILHLNNLYAQPIAEKNAEGYVNGKIVLPGQANITGQIKDNIRKKGEVVLLRDGKKTRFKANEISAVELEGASYITQEDIFYEILWQGKNLTLLRKANNSSGIHFNGTEAVVSTSPGNLDDLLLIKAGEKGFYLLTKKTQKEVLGNFCKGCTELIDESKIDVDTIKKLVATCDSCK